MKKRRLPTEAMYLLLLLLIGMMPLAVAAFVSMGSAALVGSGTVYVPPPYTAPVDGVSTPIAPAPTFTPTPTHTPTVVPTATPTPTATPAVAQVIVSPDSIVVTLDQRSLFQAQVLDMDGNRLFDRPVTWSSGNTEVVDVSPEGVATGVNIGCAFVTATSAGRRGIGYVSVILRSGESRVVWVTFDRAVDTATISPSDFTVDGAPPFSANAGPGPNQATLVVPVYVYAPMPLVELVGLVADLRGSPASITCVQPGT